MSYDADAHIGPFAQGTSSSAGAHQNTWTCGWATHAGSTVVNTEYPVFAEISLSQSQSGASGLLTTYDTQSSGRNTVTALNQRILFR